MNNAHRRAPRRSARRLPRWLKRGLRACARAARWWAASPRDRCRFRAAEHVLGAALAAQGQGTGEQIDERRCGWFDSSQDLREGLSISEHEAQDALCAQLPVMAWVQLQLSGWRARVEPALP